MSELHERAREDAVEGSGTGDSMSDKDHDEVKEFLLGFAFLTLLLVGVPVGAFFLIMSLIYGR